MSLYGIQALPVISADTQLAELILRGAHQGSLKVNHRKSGSQMSIGGRKLSDNPAQTGEAGCENLDFCQTSFMNDP